MNFLSKKCANALSGGALIILHICLPFILLTFLGAAAYCANIGEYDPLMAEYMFFEATEQVLTSLFICLVGAIVLDLAERDQKMR